jgi:hypothetical protein
VSGHEVDGFGRYFVGGDGEVAFVFAILIIHNDKDLTLTEVIDGVCDGGEWHGLGLKQIGFEKQPQAYAWGSNCGNATGRDANGSSAGLSSRWKWEASF